MQCAVVCQMTNELEVVLQANTNSYIGFGWKPASEQRSAFICTYCSYLLTCTYITYSVGHTKREEIGRVGFKACPVEHNNIFSAQKL